jgi:hypothetical protein
VELVGGRLDVAFAMEKYRLSERHACELNGLDRSTYRYEPEPDRNAELRANLTELALLDAGDPVVARLEIRSFGAGFQPQMHNEVPISADQRGHGVGVAIEEYTKTSLQDRAVAARKLEEAVLGKPKVVRMVPRRKAS